MYSDAVFLSWQHNVCTLGNALCFEGYWVKLGFHISSNGHDDDSLMAVLPLLNVCRVTIFCPFPHSPSSTVDHLPDKETRKRKPKKTFEIDFSDDVNFDTYFRTTRVRAPSFVISNTTCWLLERAAWFPGVMNCDIYGEMWGLSKDGWAWVFPQTSPPRGWLWCRT